MKKTKEIKYAAFVGVDWGDKEHAVCLQEAGSERIERWTVRHTPQELRKWLDQLKERSRGEPVAVGVELTKGPVVSALLQHPFVHVFPINPSTLARYRKAWFPSGAKDDPSDAKLALEVLVKHPEKVYRLQLQGPDMRALQKLVEDRRRLVEQRVRLTNRLTSALKEYFPQVLEWFEHKGTMIFCDFLERWDSPEKARRARRSSIESFMKSHNVKDGPSQKRCDEMHACESLTNDPGVILPAQLAVASLVPMLRACVEAIANYDKEIARLEAKHEDHRIFRSFPAAGEALAPRLLALFGEDRARFRSAAHVQQYCGVAPVTERSGKQSWVHWRFASATFPRQTLVEWAGLTVTKSYWAERFYRRQRERGAGHQSALRALAYKWARILYTCWKNGETYDESRYLKALHRRGSELVVAAEKSTS